MTCPPFALLLHCLEVVDGVQALLHLDGWVERIDDLLTGVDGFPPGDVLRLWLADGSRVIVRPSGTEPKIKLYVFAKDAGREAADALLNALEEAGRKLLA